MARLPGLLKASQIAQLGPGKHHDGGGLYLVVGKGGARSWVFRYQRDGRVHEHGLGSARWIGLAKARAKLLACRSALNEGGNPAIASKLGRIERVKAAARGLTFAEASERCIAAKAAGWRDKRTERQWRQSLADFAYPVLGPLPVATIDTALVLQVLAPIWETKTVTASRVRERIEAVLDWAAPEYRQGDNPARWKGLLQHKLARPRDVRQKQHHPALPFAEIGNFMAALRQQQGAAARALEFAILTAARTDQALGARWSEIDITKRLWTIPAARMKDKKREHRVPLSDATLRVVEAMAAGRIAGQEYVFPGRGHKGALGPQALRRVRDALGRADIDVHGFRSTFRDWAGEVTAYPREVAEMALSHAVGNQVETAYRRGDLFEKRRALMRDWAQRCAGGAEVEPLPVRLEA